MGVGWWQYQNKPNSYTESLYKAVLSNKYMHSVRDSYTKKMLASIGINNVINTTCPTLWQLSKEHCATIPTSKAKSVITTLTFYKRNVELDFKLLDILLRNYENVHLWIQGIEDLDYLKEILPDYERVKLVAPTMEAYNNLLDQDDVEYLGTRLHAGVRAIQKGKRALIVAVDNRAIEISKDTNLNVIDRNDVELVNDFINNEYVTDINLPIDNINAWKAQFAKQ
jgi:polysaccharide pyruvyl transferase WcaK-like protein